MGKLPRLGKPPFLKPHHVQPDDLVEIVEEPYVRGSEESMFGKTRGYAVVRLMRTGDLYTWGFNTTTWDRLIKAFGDESSLWIGKRVKIKVEKQLVRGEEKPVLYGVPYREPQQQLQPNPLDKAILNQLKALPMEQKHALLQALKESVGGNQETASETG